MTNPPVMRSPEELGRENAELRRAVEELRRANDRLNARLHESCADLDLANEQVEQLAAIVESSDDAVVGCTLGGLVTIWNRGAERLFGYSADEVIGQPTSTNARLDWPEELRAMKRLRDGESVPPFETVRRRKDGKEIHVSVCVSPVRDRAGRVVGASAISRDITERRRLEGQVRQSQKMEALGQLAGGVAHDFNNLLTIIKGYSELLLGSCRDESAKGPLEEVRKAAGRAAALTRQLLAFSRKQVLEPRVLDLNAVVTDTANMLKRLIGEDIELATALAPALGRVRADPGQVEQVLVNLAVNARDAMPQGGRLTVETADVELDETYTRAFPDVRPGPYVLLAVSDTGCGMDGATQARIFEPFFTTKGEGKGTGLGLATVFGIVKQSGGHVSVYSEPGRGAAFKVYLPRAEGGMPAVESLAGQRRPRRGTETVLLVEDEPALLALSRQVLQAQGYTVLGAGGGEEAVRVAQEYGGPIHLVVTDVVMPGLSGRQVAQRVAALRPGVGLLFVSGYTDDAVVRHGVLRAETAFLQKPFTPGALAQKVRAVLDRADPAAGRAG